MNKHLRRLLLVPALVVGSLVVLAGPAAADSMRDYRWEYNHTLVNGGTYSVGDVDAFWQSALASEGLLSACQIDGIYGPTTGSRTGQYQQRYGLTADGIVGPQTWAKARSFVFIRRYFAVDDSDYDMYYYLGTNSRKVHLAFDAQQTGYWRYRPYSYGASNYAYSHWTTSHPGRTAPPPAGCSRSSSTVHVGIAGEETSAADDLVHADRPGVATDDPTDGLPLPAP